MKTKRIFLGFCAFFLLFLGFAAHSQNMTSMSPAAAAAAAAAAQADGQGLANGQLAGPKTPAVLIPMGATPGANNIMGGQYTGAADPGLTGLVVNPSLVTTGGSAKTTSVTGFTGYSNDRLDQSNQAAYFVTSTPMPSVLISPADPIAQVANLPATPTGIASGSSVVCTSTVTPLPFDPSISYNCNETYNQYVTSCSLDHVVSISSSPVCDPAIAPGGTFNTVTSPVTNGFIGMSHAPVVSCGTSPVLNVNLGTIPGSQQCHGGGCNSDYYEFIMPIVRGAPSSKCQWQARIYTGTMWGYMCANYDGVDTITVPPFDMAAGYSAITSYTCGHSGSNPCYSWTLVKNPGGSVLINGGHRMQNAVSYGPVVDNCLSLSGLQ